MMFLAGLRELARALGCRDDQAPDVVKSEPSARLAMSRRGLFKASGAVAAGTLFAFSAPAASKWLLTYGDYAGSVAIGGSKLHSFNGLLKAYYSRDVVSRLVSHSASPLLAIIPKEEELVIHGS